MPNKKKQRNSFYCFMKDMQEKLAGEGQIVPMSKMPEYAHPIWKKMSLAEKEKYEVMAKGYKLEYREFGRLASDGTSIRENKEEEERKEEREIEMRHGVIDMLRISNSTKEEFINAVIKKKFYFMTFNILCFVEGGTFIPNEVGVIEYSIADGIIKEYHKFIHPGPIPKGYTGEAKRHSEATHQIPISGHEDSERDYSKIWDELTDFINPPMARSGVLPPVFCLKNDIDQTHGSLVWLAARSGVKDVEELKVWDAGLLLMELRAGTECKFASYAIAADLLMKNTFDYIPNPMCSFHDELDSTHCAFGYAKRLCYLLSDSICTFVGVSVTERHLPVRAQNMKPYEVHQPSFPNLTFASNERGMGRRVPIMQDNFSIRTESSLDDRSYSSLSMATNSSLQERIEPDSYNTSASSSFVGTKSLSTLSVNDSENGRPDSFAGNFQRMDLGTKDEKPLKQPRQPISMSFALTYARHGQNPAPVPGHGIGRAQRKLP